MIPVRLGKRLLALAVPATIALAAFFQARAVGALVEGSALQGAPAAGVAPYVVHRAELDARKERPSASVFSTHHPFEHGASAAAKAAAADGDPCPGVRVAFAVAMEHEDVSFAAIERDGKSYLRARGGTIGDLRVASVAPDRVLFERSGGGLCETRVFPAALRTPSAPSPTIAGMPGIARLSATSFEIDRSVLEKLLENQTDLAKTPLVPERGGARLVRVKEGSLLAQLGFQAGDRLVSVNGMELSSPEKLLELWARVRGGSIGRITISIERGGKPIELDFKVV